MQQVQVDTLYITVGLKPSNQQHRILVSLLKVECQQKLRMVFDD